MPKANGKATSLGCIDAIFGDTLVGWFHNSKEKMPLLHLRVNGQVKAGKKPVKTGRARPDVAEKFGIPQECGFRIKLNALSKNRVSVISLVHKPSGFDFHTEALSYCPKVAEFSDALRKVFLPEFYRHKYGHESLSNERAFEHYIQFGIYSGLNPNPWFSTKYVEKHHASEIEGYDLAIIAYLELEHELQISPSKEFDPQHYSICNPDVNLAMGYLAHFVHSGAREGRVCVNNPLPGMVRQEMAELCAIEPDLQRVGGFADKVVRYPNLTAATYIPRLIQRRFSDRPKVVICVPFLSLGGSDLIATYVQTALEGHYGVDDVLMIVTDRCEHSVSDWVNEESNIIFLDEGSTLSNKADRIDLLHSVIGYLKPEKIININSNACWGMYLHYGLQVSQYVEMNAYLFCFDYDLQGRMAGYIRDFVPSTVGYMTSIFCDNATVINDAKALYGFSDEDARKFHTVYVPAPTDMRAINIADTADYNKPILWIGRLARQKRPEILLEIATRMSNQQFVVYGPMGDSPAAQQIVNGSLSNIEYRGVYTSFSELDFSEFSLYLNTSAWEGLPTVIIQIMSVGLPVLTSSAGGIAELVTPKTGWLVPHDSDPASYITELRQLFLHPQVARMRATQGQALTAERHNWGAFVEALTEAGCFRDAQNRAQAPLKAVPVSLAS